MKANAPEKLYFGGCNKNILELYSDKVFGNDIEYTRTNVFIKKACNAYCKVCKMPNCKSNECKFIEDFKNYMKGE